MNKLSKYLKKMAAVLLAAVMIVSSLGSLGVLADEDDFGGGDIAAPTKRAEVIGGLESLVGIVPGKTTHVEVPIRVLNDGFGLMRVSAECSNPLISVSNIKMLDSYGEDTKLNGESGGHSFYNGYKAIVVMDVYADEELKVGYNTIKLMGYGTADHPYIGGNDVFEIVSIVTLNEFELQPAMLVASKVVYSDTVKPGASLKAKIYINNQGDMRSLNTTAQVDFGDSGLVPDYAIGKLAVGNIGAKEATTVDIPVKVPETANPGTGKITVTLNGKSKSGESLGPFVYDIYVTIVRPEDEGGASKLPSIQVTTEDNYKLVAVQRENKITLELSNKGESSATSVKVACTAGMDTASGITRKDTSEILEVGTVKAGASKKVEIPFMVSKNAAEGLHELGFTVSYVDSENKEHVKNLVVYINVPSAGEEISDENAPVVDATTDDNYKSVAGMTNDVFTLNLKNIGVETASGVNVKCVAGMDTASGITKKFTTDAVGCKDLKKGESASVQIPFTVSKNAAAGLHELVFAVNYKDKNGKNYTNNVTVYIKVTGTDSSFEDGALKNAISILNITQSPASPVAGENVTVSFTVKNDGNAAVDNVRVYGSNLGGSGFEAVTNDPYNRIGSLDPGAGKAVSITLKCSDTIPSGTATLGIGVDYLDKTGTPQAVNENIYVLGIKSKGAADVGRPKLIVSAFGTDEEVLKAGSEFNFSFTLKNTHAVKAAKNIKITLIQDEGIFSPSRGTNILYIDAIEAGQEYAQEVTLKAKADAATGDYTLKLLLEYEYDDMSDVDKEKGGVNEENAIKLRAIENYRPVIENIMIDAWDGINVGSPVDLSFEFYNMGKSTLGNVYVTVEGDFELANNSNMSYIGAISGYSQEYVNPSVVALVGGDATGVLTVHFEDSNGDEVTLSQNFSAYVNDPFAGGDFGDGMIDDGGMFMPGFEDEGMFMPGFEEEGGEQTGKKILGMNLWVFILVCVAAAAVVAVIVIFAVKAKKKKAAKENDDEDY